MRNPLIGRRAVIQESPGVPPPFVGISGEVCSVVGKVNQRLVVLRFDNPVGIRGKSWPLREDQIRFA